MLRRRYPLPIQRLIVAPSLRTSGVLTALVGLQGQRIFVGDIIAALKDRAYALLLVLLGLPNCLPMPPPIPLICGLVLVSIALQMIFGRNAPWLPASLLRRSIARHDLARAVERALPALARLEAVSRPRLTVLGSRFALPIVGLVLLVLALGLIVSAPFVGQIPLGLAVCLVGFGLVERDGLFVLGGAVIGAFGLALSAGFAYALVSGISELFWP
jgi:hypothetical protein